MIQGCKGNAQKLNMGRNEGSVRVKEKETPSNNEPVSGREG